MYSSATPGRKGSRMTNLGFPGAPRTPAVTGRGNASTMDIPVASRPRLMNPVGSGRPTNFLPAPPRGAGPTRFLPSPPRGAGSEGMGIANPEDVARRVRAQQLVAGLTGGYNPMANVPMSIPQGEVPTFAGADYEALRNRAMQDYFASLQGLMS